MGVVRSTMAVLAAVTLLAVSCSGSGPALVATDDPVATPTAAPAPANEPADADDGDSNVTTDTATAEPEPPAATPPTATPLPTGTPTAQRGGCTAPLAGDPQFQQTATADFDGDGSVDLVTIYGIGQGAIPRDFRIRVDTAAGESLDSPLAVEVGSSIGATPLGGADVDGDGATQELFSTIGAGAAVAIVVIHTRDGCEIVQASAGNTPVTFPVGGSVGNIAGLECRDTDGNGVNNTVIAWTGEADFNPPNGDYFLTGVEYRLEGSVLQQVATPAKTANISEADFVYSQLSCGAVNL